MADFGLKISEAGTDVKTATDRQLVFSNQFNYLKTYLVGTSSITITAGTTTATKLSTSFSHNLGYVPAVQVWINDGTYAAPISFTARAFATRSALVDRSYYNYYVNSTDIKFYLKTDDSTYWPQGADKIIYFKYYIFTQQMA